jgi:diguanylate cyclase (GGDEF)-like protein
MLKSLRIFDGRRLLILLAVLLSLGFFAVSLFGYYVSREAIRSAIVKQNLPLTSSNIYAEIQRDLIRPVLISSTMAHDTFLREWVVRGERNPNELAAYLAEIKKRNGAFSSFFVSDRTRAYYTGNGVLKQVDRNDQHDSWYFRMKEMTGDYVIDVDTDQANRNALTIFINYRVFDFDNRFIGVTGIGLTVDSVRRLIDEYQQRYSRSVYFVDANGKVVVSQDGQQRNLHEDAGVSPILGSILSEMHGSYRFKQHGENHLLYVNYLPELKWYLFVEQSEDKELEGIRRTLYVNLFVSLFVTAVVIYLTRVVLHRYQSRLEKMAATDELTGLFNRRAFSVVQARLMASYRRKQRPLSVLLVDVDHFKQINDRYGHQVGDQVLSEVSSCLKAAIRGSDVIIRWGGEEFLVVLDDCEPAEAARIAEKLRLSVENLTPTGVSAGEVACSVGVAGFGGGKSLEQTISHADKALYRAKREGRNRVCVAETN